MNWSGSRGRSAILALAGLQMISAQTPAAFPGVAGYTAWRPADDANKALAPTGDPPHRRLLKNISTNKCFNWRAVRDARSPVWGLK